MKLLLPSAHRQNSGLAAALFAALLVTATLSLPLALTGVFGAMARLHPAVFALALGCSALALMLGVVAGYTTLQNRAATMYTVALLTSGLALVLVAIGAGLVWAAAEAPRVALEPRGGMLDARAAVGSLAPDDRLHLSIEPLDAGGKPGAALYSAQTGANRDGEAALRVRLPRPSGAYAALRARAWIGGGSDASVTLTSSSSAPQLAAQFTRGGSAIAISARGPAGQALRVRVVAVARRRHSWLG